LVRRSHR